MGRAIQIILYFVILVQFLGGANAFYRSNPLELVKALSPENAAFIGLFLLIHVLGLVGAVLVLFRLRIGFMASIAHQLLMVVGIKVANTFNFLTHDVLSFFVFVVSRFDEYSVTWRWTAGMRGVYAQLAIDTRGTYIGLNLFALACAGYLWWVMKAMQAEAEEAERMRRAAMRRPPRPAHMQQGQGRPQQRRAV